MFELSINNLRGFIAGCPTEGLAAIDYRRAYGLSDRPTNRIDPINPDTITSEAICRRYANRLDRDANLSLGADGLTYPPAVIQSFAALAKELWHDNPKPHARAAICAFLDAYFAAVDARSSNVA